MKTDVLICGAGPTGLTAALYLAQRGLQVQIFDRSLARSSKSKAIGVQPGTLELLDVAIGPALTAEMTASGIWVKSLHLHTQTKTVDVQPIEVASRYPSILLLPQDQTERILEENLERLGVKVLRQHDMAALEQNAGAVRARMSNGRELSAQLFIGADGPHSVTRQALGIEFPGGSYQGLFALADLRAHAAWSPGSIHAYASAHGAAACFPLPQAGQYRVILIPKSTPPDTPTELTFERFQQEAKAYFPNEIRFSDPTWLSRFYVHHRLAGSFGRGRIFIAGDAAHIHSPVGAQGMNTGIHDAINLGHKMVQVLKEGRALESLSFYEDERRPVAERIVFWTDLTSRQILARETWLTRFVREKVFPRIIAQNWLRQRAFQAVAQIRECRREIERLYERG
jgi:2-polyprenyl-6-methoxyphenol hydroxylase-like FAD-dependent oxidoreductase